jgi:hypothetical protein
MLSTHSLNRARSIAVTAVIAAATTLSPCPSLAAAGKLVPKGSTYYMLDAKGGRLKTLPGGTPLPASALIAVNCPRIVLTEARAQGASKPTCWRMVK